jgi:uncharacterized protein with von Willebrand factor type A (vWA) domain
MNATEMQKKIAELEKALAVSEEARLRAKATINKLYTTIHNQKNELQEQAKKNESLKDELNRKAKALTVSEEARLRAKATINKLHTTIHNQK